MAIHTMSGQVSRLYFILKNRMAALTHGVAFLFIIIINQRVMIPPCSSFSTDTPLGVFHKD